MMWDECLSVAHSNSNQGDLYTNDAAALQASTSLLPQTTLMKRHTQLQPAGLKLKASFNFSERYNSLKKPVSQKESQ